MSEVERALQWLDPDIVVTEGGDATGFPALIFMASSAGIEARLGRKKKRVVLRRDAVTTWSYGRVVRSEAYHALEGRVHIDRGSSFIFKEGGIEGMFEISRMSGIPCQICPGFHRALPYLQYKSGSQWKTESWSRGRRIGQRI